MSSYSPPPTTEDADRDDGKNGEDGSAVSCRRSPVMPAVSKLLEGHKLVPDGKLPNPTKYELFAVFDLLSGEEVYRRDRVAEVSDVDLRCFTQPYSTEDRPLLMVSYSEKD